MGSISNDSPTHRPIKQQLDHESRSWSNDLQGQTRGQIKLTNAPSQGKVARNDSVSPADDP